MLDGVLGVKGEKSIISLFSFLFSIDELPFSNKYEDKALGYQYINPFFSKSSNTPFLTQSQTVAFKTQDEHTSQNIYVYY